MAMDGVRVIFDRLRLDQRPTNYPSRADQGCTYLRIRIVLGRQGLAAGLQRAHLPIVLGVRNSSCLIVGLYSVHLSQVGICTTDKRNAKGGNN